MNNSFHTSQSIFLVIRSHQHNTDLHRICPLLSLKTSVLLVKASVSSGLDCCSPPFVSLTDFELRRFQWVKNLHPSQPAYLSELIHPNTSSKNARNISPKHFFSSFSHHAPVLWNSSPFQIRNTLSATSFRKHLTTYLFNSSFPTLSPCF